MRWRATRCFSHTCLLYLSVQWFCVIKSKLVAVTGLQSSCPCLRFHWAIDTVWESFRDKTVITEKGDYRWVGDNKKNQAIHLTFFRPNWDHSSWQTWKMKTNLCRVILKASVMSNSLFYYRYYKWAFIVKYSCYDLSYALLPILFKSSDWIKTKQKW